MIREHHNFPSRFLKNRRTLSLYLPPDYGADPTRRYPVFYLHDGQNLFSDATAYTGVSWRAHETADRLILDGLIQPVILVGIANTPDRLEEYGPKAQRAKGNDRTRRYGRFVVEEVKPFIDRRYRTKRNRKHTAVGGSSMGALISLYLAKRHSDVFSMCAALSPSLWWERVMFLRSLRGRREWLRTVRFWIDTGDREGNSPQSSEKQVEYTRRFAANLKAIGLRAGSDYRYLKIAGGEHNEHAWAARFGQVLTFLFGTKGNAHENG